LSDTNRLFAEERDKMVKSLLVADVLKTPAIIDAFFKVPRHKYLGKSLKPQNAYANRAIMIKYPVSSASQPLVMAYMLEVLDLHFPMRVLEIGTASGYNAALLCEILGDPGLVYTIEYEKDLAREAGKILTDYYAGINVFWGDGTKGWPHTLEFDRIIVTAEMTKLYSGLLNQLKYGGLLLSPFNFGGLSTLIIKVYKNDYYRGEALPFPVSFVPLRGDDGGEVKYERLMEQMWCGIYRQIKYMNMDSPFLWGAFLSFIGTWLAGQRDMLPVEYLRIWEEEGGLPCYDYHIYFSRTGYLERVIRKE